MEGETSQPIPSPADDPLRSEAANPWLWRTLKMPCRLATTLMFDLKVYGRQHIPTTDGALLISNHQSNLDPILLAVHLRRAPSFMAKIELFEHRQFGWLIRNLNAFPIRRGEADVSAIKEAIHRLQEGRMLIMFPEGTRTRDGSIGRIQPGIARLIRRAEVPVIPAVIDGAYLAWPRGQKVPHAHPIRVAYGPALNLEGVKGTEIVPLIEKTLNAMLAELRRRDTALRPTSAT